jgi:hypothetical protein
MSTLYGLSNCNVIMNYCVSFHTVSLSLFNDVFWIVFFFFGCITLECQGPYSKLSQRACSVENMFVVL